MRKYSELKGFRRKARRIWTNCGDLVRNYITRPVSDAWYWVRTHTYNRYHLIDIRGQADYKWGYLDADQSLLLASFKILSDFVDLEDPKCGLRTLADYMGEYSTEDDIPMYENALTWGAEIRALYNWWKVERPKEHLACHELLDGVEVDFGDTDSDIPHVATMKINKPEACRAFSNEQDRLYDKDTSMLIRLAKVRLHLWT